MLRLLKDPTKTVDDMIEVVYGPENPVMDKTLTPGRGSVTRVVLGNPIYRVFTDLLERKRQVARARRDALAMAQIPVRSATTRGKSRIDRPAGLLRHARA